MEEDTSLLWRKSKIIMQEPKVITIGDVMDLTVMHINKGNAHGTQGERSKAE